MTKYFDKKGHRPHGVAITYRDEMGEPIKTRYLDMIMTDHDQNCDSVQIAIEGLVLHIKKRFPNKNVIILQSDNAGAFSATENFTECLRINRKLKDMGHDLRIVQWLFTEAQQSMGWSMNNITCPLDIFKALVRWDPNKKAGTRTIKDTAVFLVGSTDPFEEKCEAMKKKTTVHGAQEIPDVFITETGMIIHSQTGILPVVVIYPDDKELLPFDMESIYTTATIKEKGTGTKHIFTNDTESAQGNILVEAVLSFCNGFQLCRRTVAINKINSILK
ncbi:hypothetical protein SARC_11445 [Sphaeroforma arctica JP610]|uniref:Uncharacterized protein n=1 Tax=Sphaeroforma arctica JP610 TaxID=667725 RepID=A0A0L0FGZ0_9EUKA|nr:hypothetical protein SARC_11445 [Sphaeroforma arctica JP610]KNC76044.1 hypothetical protein SARC_11445 [Sphaeroforma arctica JP610]|eukprot:XP_014149946.1 hypothetical protein SARC_11445 [Sphaeroforma arctica JP610]